MLRSKAFLLLGAMLLSGVAQAYVVTINPGPRAVYLRVGDGAFTGQYQSGGTPGSLATVNVVSVAVPAAAVGNGTLQAMTTAARLTSDLDGFAFCNAGQVYIGGFYREPGNVGTASLIATAPTSLTNAAGDTIPFSQISWTSTGNGDASEPIPAGTFSGGAQTLTTFPVNTWRESCHGFRYANGVVVAAGVYSGRVVYTLSAP
jgi:hypothetical protein